MVIRPASVGLILAVAVAVNACNQFEKSNHLAFEAYHNSRWHSVITAVSQNAGELPPGKDMAVPWSCQEKIEPGYAGIVSACARERETWNELRDNSITNIEFVAEMLDVLTGRDTISIEMLTPQIDRFISGHAQAAADWHTARQSIATDITDLKGEWDAVWPGNQLEFTFFPALEAIRLSGLEFDDLRVEALSHYHENEYNRLAMVYLDYDPGGYVAPKSHIPQDCGELSLALRRLEAGLLVRYSMDQAIEIDVERIEELANINLTDTPWDKIEIPSSRYTRPRVNASLARLKLLKYIDQLLVGSLDVLVRDTDLAWQHVWPGNTLETNIFAYAGLEDATKLTDPLAGLTFRTNLTGED